MAGLAFVGYGLYVASQRSGTFVFPALIFVVPVAAVVKVVSDWPKADARSRVDDGQER